jgi:hypothetical protein
MTVVDKIDQLNFIDVAEILRYIDEDLYDERPDRWIQDNFEMKDLDGNIIAACLVGSVRLATMSPRVENEVVYILWEAIQYIFPYYKRMPWETIPAFNDSPRRKFEHIKQVLKRAREMVALREAE